MARAIIRVTLQDVTDEKALEIKKAIEEAVKGETRAQVELTVMTR